MIIRNCGKYREHQAAEYKEKSVKRRGKSHQIYILHKLHQGKPLQSLFLILVNIYFTNPYSISHYKHNGKCTSDNAHAWFLLVPTLYFIIYRAYSLTEYRIASDMNFILKENYIFK